MDYAIDCMGNEILPGDVIAWPQAYGCGSTIITRRVKVTSVHASPGKWTYPWYLKVNFLIRDRDINEWHETGRSTIVRKVENVTILNLGNDIVFSRRGTQTS